ncbi:MAG: Glycosyl hydrolase [Microgenomates group bacterium GW2011_GWA2_39_19]|nr:MAG: Glycosyl hydrolase [Microgenomates group bacterium GW2011_GWA2_39_19]
MILFLGMASPKKTSVSIAMPVYNEEVDLPRNIPVLQKFLRENFKDYDWEIVIADNGPSKDRTGEVGRELEKKYKGVKYMLIPRSGRGGALKEVWLKSKSDIVAYMDIDLSSDLRYFSKLIKAIEKGSDIAIGSRLAKGAKVYGRTLLREVMSRGYNLLIKFFFWTSFNDAQCGFKAMSHEAARKLLPAIEDKAWFFDSEFLVVGECAGLKVTEIPIVWRDDPRSTVKVAKTAMGDLKGLYRLFRTRPWKKLKNEWKV